MNEPNLLVLLVEDNPGDARLIRETLADARAPFALETVERLDAALARLAAGGVDAVLLDLALPDSRGYDTFATVHARAPETPIIVLTGLGDESLALRTVRDGAQDYLVKGQVDGNILTRSVRYAIERHHIRQEISRLNEELEHRVVARTAELTAANQELETFTYSVSHDLRAPLRQTDGFARILQEEHAAGLDAAARHCLDRIREGTQHMGRLVDDLLNLARVGRAELHVEPRDLNSLVRAAVADLELELQGRVVEWRIGPLPTVACDAGLMSLIFANLLSNAVKFTRPRAQAVIEVGRLPTALGPAVFVRDNGVGFDMRYADKLFGVFQRLHRAEDFEGTGVGLATVQRIIHKHHGRVWAEAELDKGTTFYFTIGAPAPEPMRA